MNIIRFCDFGDNLKFYIGPRASKGID